MQVKLCDPCLSALYVPWCEKALYKYSSLSTYSTMTRARLYTNLDLALRHAECKGQSRPLGSREVLGLFKRLLQCKYLMPGKRRTSVLSLGGATVSDFVRTLRTETAQRLMIAERSYHICSQTTTTKKQDYVFAHVCPSVSLYILRES